jgi:hypothetical protein
VDAPSAAIDRTKPSSTAKVKHRRLKEARPQCETNHIVVAMAALICSRNDNQHDNQNASRAIMTARLFPRNMPMRRGQLSR